MNEWGVVLVIVTLITLVAGVTGPVVKLNNSITKLNVVLDGLEKDVTKLETGLERELDTLRRESAEKRRRMHQKLDDHERRLTGLEHSRHPPPPTQFNPTQPPKTNHKEATMNLTDFSDFSAGLPAGLGQYLRAELAALPLVLYAIGAAIKHSRRLADNIIPLAVGGCGVALALLWVLATSPIAGWQQALMAIFTAIVQGVLCAAASVYAHQLAKQGRQL